MSSRARFVLVSASWLASLAVGLVGLGLTLAYPAYLIGLGSQAPVEIQVAAFLPAALALPTVGAIVASRRTRHPVGWLLLVSGLALNTGLLSGTLITYLGYELAFARSIARVPFWTGIALSLLAWLYFPTGRLPTRRWRVATWLLVLCIVLNHLVTALSLAGQGDAPSGTTAETVFTLLTVLSIPLTATAFVRRFSGASPLERQQLKWLLYPALPMAGAFLIAALATALAGQVDTPSLSSGISAAVTNSLIVAFALFFGLLPIGAGIAILRFHLLDVDLLINRTLVYGTLTALIAGLYAATITIFVELLKQLVQPVPLIALVILTLLVHTLFTPVKNRLQRYIDRVVPPEKDPARELGAFGEQVATMQRFVNVSQLNTDGLLRELVSCATGAFGAAGGAILLGNLDSQQVAHTAGRWDGMPQVSVPIQSEGETLGVLALGPRVGERPYELDDREILRKATEIVAPLVRARALERRKQGRPNRRRPQSA